LSNTAGWKLGLDEVGQALRQAMEFTFEAHKRWSNDADELDLICI